MGAIGIDGRGGVSLHLPGARLGSYIFASCAEFWYGRSVNLGRLGFVRRDVGFHARTVTAGRIGNVAITVRCLNGLPVFFAPRTGGRGLNDIADLACGWCAANPISISLRTGIEDFARLRVVVGHRLNFEPLALGAKFLNVFSYARRGGCARLVIFKIDHAEFGHVQVNDGLNLKAFVAIHPALLQDDLHRLGVEAVALGLREHFLDVVGDRRLLLVEALDTLEQGAKLSVGPAHAPAPM